MHLGRSGSTHSLQKMKVMLILCVFSGSDVGSKGPGVLHFPLSVPSCAQLHPHSFQSILNRGWARTDELDTCAVPPTWLALCLNIHLAHALLYTHHPLGLKHLPSRGQGARLSASLPDDENDVMRTVRGCGRPKYTLALNDDCYIHYYIQQQNTSIA